MKIEHFTGDVTELIDVVKAWHEECESERFGISISIPDVLQDLKILKKEENCILLVLRNNEESPVGYMGVRLFKSPLGPDLIANEHYWYVMRSNRGVGAVRMLAAARKWAISRGATHFMANASNLASNLHDSVCEIYEGIGMTKFETTYLERLGG